MKNQKGKNNPNYKFGLCKTKFWNSWRAMKARCTSKNHKNYKKYKGLLCKNWYKFEVFYEDMFTSYKDGLTIDRIDNNLGYYKENCRWCNRQVQADNRKISVIIENNGKKYYISELSKKYNIKKKTIKARIKSGKCFRDIISKKHLQHKNLVSDI
jgi:hypothetical protein